MPREKISVEFEIKKDLDQMLEYAAEKYKIKDKSKTLRCILDYVSSEADWDTIFKKIRCNGCGPKTGWSKEEEIKK